MKRSPHRLCISCAIVVALNFCPVAAAGEKDDEKPRLTPEKKKLAARLFSAIKDSREELRSGDYIAVESRVTHHPEHGKFERSAKIRSAFDYENGLLRYDYESDDEPQTRRYYRTPEKSALYYPHAKQMSVAANVDVLSPKSVLRPLDVRVVGFGSSTEHRAGLTFERMYSLFTKDAEVVDVALDKQKNLYHLVLSQRIRKIVVHRHFWIDRERGHVPVRYHYRFRKLDDDKWSEPRATVAITWEKGNGVWVPMSVKANEGSAEDVWKLRFTWVSVNKGVDPALFKRKSLKPAPGTHVVDVSDRKRPKLIETIPE